MQKNNEKIKPPLNNSKKTNEPKKKIVLPQKNNLLRVFSKAKPSIH
jgi:hypothetical protein